jgi:dihydroflavonol-4-reductase
MTCFITGGTGRLGKALLNKLIGRQEVRVLDPDNTLLPEKVIPIKGDLDDVKALSRGIAGCDVVFHLAALVDYNAPWSRLEEVNVQGTRNIVDMCAKHRIRRLIFISSTSVYGKELKESPANEETPTNPTDLYGKSKLEAERIVGEHFTDVQSTILRPGVMYGPTYLDYYGKVLRAIQQGKMQILGDGKNVIPFIHADDVVDAMIKAAAFDAAKGKTYVLSGNNSVTQEQIYEIAAQALGVDFKKQYTNLGLARAMLAVSSIFSKSPMTQEDINVLSSHRIFDTLRAENELKWKPTPIDVGIRQMVDIYKARLAEAKKRRFLEYQREMLKQGKFVGVEAGRVVETSEVDEEPISDADSELKSQSLLPIQPIQQKTQLPTQPAQAQQSKPKYWQPMPKEPNLEARPAPPMQPVMRAEAVQPKPEPKQASGSFFGITLPIGQSKSEKAQTVTTYKPEAGSEKYTNALSKMAPVVKSGGEPPKPPPSVLKYMQPQSQSQQPAPRQLQQTQLTPRQITQPAQRPPQAAQQAPQIQRAPSQPVQQMPTQRAQQPQGPAGKGTTVGTGRSWLDSVLKDIKKDSEKKDDTNR